MLELNRNLPNELATRDFAGDLVQTMPASGAVVYLQGDLGAGKTTLVRGMLQSMGYTGRVVSPTYTLIEPYLIDQGRRVYHLDLYRVMDTEELELLGLRDIDTARDLVLVEWPEKAVDGLPAADLLLLITDAGSGSGRQLQILAKSFTGQQWLDGLQEASDSSP